MVHRSTTVVKPGFRIFPDRQTCMHKLHRTSTMVKTAIWIRLTLKQACMSFTGLSQWCKLPSDSFSHTNWHEQAAQDLHSGENCSLGNSWHRKWTAQPSQDLHCTKNSFLAPSWETNGCKRHTHDLHNGENCFVNHFWRTNWSEKDSQDHSSGENSLLYPSWHANWHLWALHNLYTVVTRAFWINSRHWNRREQASLDLNTGEICFQSPPDTQTGVQNFLMTSTAELQNGENCRLNPFDTQTGVHELHRTFTMVKTAFWIFFTRKLTAAQDLRSGENGSLDHSWHPNWTAQPSQDLHSNSFQQLSRSLNFYSRQTRNLDLSWHWNWREQASLHLNSGKTCFQGTSWHRNIRARAS